MPSNLTRGLLIFALLVIAVVSWQWIDDRDVAPIAANNTIEMAENQSDYYLEDFEIINIANDEGAEPTAGRYLKITGQTLSHHYLEGHSVITNPVVELRSANKDQWQARAANGKVSANFEVLDLQGNVELTHKQTTSNLQTSQPVTVDTQSLSIDTGERVISTDATVQVNGDGWEYNANAMRAEIDQGTLSFTSGVEAQFASPNQR